MRFTLLAYPALVVVACGSPQRIERHEPRGYHERMAEAEDHAREAVVHEHAAAEARSRRAPDAARCGHPVVDVLADQSTSGGERIATLVPCWSVEREAVTYHEAEAIRLHREARADRAAARNLLAVETQFCRGLPPDELTHTPFYHRGDIAAVEPYVENGVVRGARIRFKPVEGLTADWLRRTLRCHRARAATIGHAPTYLTYDPTMLAPVHTTVSELAGAVRVVVRSEDDTIAAAVLARARALLEPRSPSPASPSATIGGDAQPRSPR